MQYFHSSEHVEGAGGQGHAMFPLRFYAFGWNDPDLLFKVNLRLPRMMHFTRKRRRQAEKAGGKSYGAVLSGKLRKHRRPFPIGTVHDCCHGYWIGKDVGKMNALSCWVVALRQ